MNKHPQKRQGLTLIETLIVITALAILAGMVYPYFVNTADEADESKHRAQLRLIREQINLYRVQHGGQLPNLLGNWDDLTKVTTYRGKPCGPYLRQVPKNHKRSNVFDGLKVDPPSAFGFVYDYRAGGGTGMIYATNGSGTKLTKW